MAEPYPICPIGPDEFDAFYLVDQHAFGGRPMPDRRRALAALSTAMSWDPAPWCPVIF